MKISSVKENQNLEKRVAITPDTAKKYLASGFEVTISENYGEHLGIPDKEYLELGVKLVKNDNDIIKDADVIIQLGLLTDEKKDILKKDQTIIGLLNPFHIYLIQHLLANS